MHPAGAHGSHASPHALPSQAAIGPHVVGVPGGSQLPRKLHCPT
jgi:hypothetical protein